MAWQAGPKSCVTNSGGNTTTAFNSNNCSDCTVSDRERAIDGNRETFATVGLPMVAVGSAALRAQAQQGLVFPAGQVAAAVISEGPDMGRLHIRTYLMNVFQEESALSSTTQEQVSIVGFKTTKQFDQVELLMMDARVLERVPLQNQFGFVSSVATAS